MLYLPSEVNKTKREKQTHKKHKKVKVEGTGSTDHLDEPRLASNIGWGSGWERGREGLPRPLPGLDGYSPESMVLGGKWFPGRKTTLLGSSGCFSGVRKVSSGFPGWGVPPLPSRFPASDLSHV